MSSSREREHLEGGSEAVWLAGEREPSIFPEQLHFEVTAVPDGHGADDYESDDGDAFTLRAYGDGGVIGSLDYNHEEDRTLHIRWVEVILPYRRCGVGRALISALQSRHPGCPLATNGFTDDGQPFFAAIDAEVSERYE